MKGRQQAATDVKNVLYDGGSYHPRVDSVKSGSCPRCRSTLEVDASFCHSCGLDLAMAASPGLPASGPAAPYQSSVQPFPVLPALGMEVPATPMGHERALSTLAGILIFFNAAIILILSIIYLLVRSIGREEVWVGDDWYTDRVIYWEWVLASVVMMASAGTGVAAGIASVKGTRFTMAIVGAIMLLSSAIIVQLDWTRWNNESYGQIVFVLVLALLPLPLLLMARPVFTTPLAPPGTGRAVAPTDNYGWSTTPPPRIGSAYDRGPPR